MHDLSAEPDLRVLSFLERMEKPLLLVVTMVAGGVLGLWLLPPVAAHAPAAWSKMVPATAVGMLLATASIALSAPLKSNLAVAWSRAAAAAALGVGLLALSTYALGIAPTVGSWLRAPSPQTASGLVLIGICQLLARRSGSGVASLADVAAVGLVALVLFLIGGHLFQVIELVGIDSSNLASPQTVLCLALLAAIIAERRAADGGLMAILVNKGIGSQMARKLLPGVIAAPFVVIALIAYFGDVHSALTSRNRAIAAPLLVLAALGVVAWMARHANELERELRRLSVTDQLTGVLNRRGFEVVADHVMHNARRTGASLTAFYFDLDGLKGINDSLGHEAGSVVIRRFAELLVGTFRRNDVVARMGGDEFVVLAANVSDSAGDLLARLKRAVAEYNASPLAVGAMAYSVGFAELQPSAGGQVNDIVTKADQIMYAHKVGKKAA